MLPRCGSFLSVLSHTLTRFSDPVGEHPSHSGWYWGSTPHSQGYHPTPPHFHSEKTPREDPFAVNCCDYKPCALPLTLLYLAACASYGDALSWKGGCKDAKLRFSDWHCLLYIFLTPPDLYRGGWSFRFKENVLTDIWAALFFKFASLYWLSSSQLPLFFLPLLFSLFPSFLWEKEKYTHTHKNSRAGN